MQMQVETNGDTKMDPGDLELNTPTPSTARTKRFHSFSRHVLTFDNLTFDIKVTKLGTFLHGGKVGVRRILQDVSGRVASGQVMAIIGPSGAGKTTLLDTLASQPHVVNNNNITVSGVVAVDGEKMSKDFFSERCAYLPQQDALCTALTTKEHLAYSARLYGVASDELESNCTTTMKDLGLTGCADVMVGSVFIRGLSGGQKRRLSLACELIAGNKAIYFLDEPTSGLDAAAATEIMKVVTQAAKQRNVVMVASVHQPSSRVFYAFDQLLVLSKGRTAFCGQAADALEYLDTKCGLRPAMAMNPADFVVEVVNADFADPKQVDAILDKWAACSSNQLAPSTPKSPKKGSHGRSWLVPSRSLALTSRTLRLYIRDPAVYTFRFMLYTFMSCFLGVTYYQLTYDQRDVMDRMFTIVWVVAFFSYMSMVALPSFALEKFLIVKEITNGSYSLGEYVLINSLIQIPLCLMLAILSVTLAFWIPELNPNFDRYISFVAIMAAHLYVVESVAILLAAVIPNFVLGLIFFVSFLSMNFVFNGFFVSVANIPDFLIWLYYISFFSYTNRALFKIVFDDLDMSGYDKCLELSKYPCYGESGHDVLAAISSDKLDYNETNAYEMFAVLVAMAVALRTCFFIYLRMVVL
uniref:ABC transporter domain-containing protein n=1 Tax=Pyramimonas obovata TaxID=1411642 RepID=A0A7S0QS61_9CHLO|mmetsp:Transcript_17832/g.38904  ORF Transcript_17832/g.38904 Transcript_17832/m.38904 type:complete len:638 (+) Transcript_17832:207-2120(+)|eukprot:CAMPEP_0118937888 /NCGR_PEP_ID=MMETSP1169-20130426/24063_1 /TAXON_ID=36882 /ORGANISM="Pyramimonas obovata, Strain CCMP722" /LENGTH=637 /DNA_ID=CAMNT_0006881651 /DNA_START=116 /DNA_END=2029 /DNA_ORIENTATION=-